MYAQLKKWYDQKAKMKTTTDVFFMHDRRAYEQQPIPCALDTLSSFAVLGFDLKITPDNLVKCIEVNGIHSGMGGYDTAGVLVGSQSAELALQSHLASRGKNQLAYIGSRLALKKYLVPRLGAIHGTCSYPPTFVNNLCHLLWHGKLRPHPLMGLDLEWSRYTDFSEQLYAMECILTNKLKTAKMFCDTPDVKPSTDIYTKHSLEKLISDTSPEYIVFKPYNGCQGKDVNILSVHGPFPQLDFSSVIEPFIPSKPIISLKDTKAHDGCMRYVVFVAEDTQGKITISHFSGYWRLCPRPIDEQPHLDAMRANLKQGAIAQKTSTEDLLLAYDTIERITPPFYRNLIQSANIPQGSSTLHYL